jgi:hypothetical protein
MTVNRSNHSAFSTKNLVGEFDDQPVRYRSGPKFDDQIHGFIWRQVQRCQ